MRRYALLAGILSIASVAFSFAVAAGLLRSYDHQVASAFNLLYQASLLPLFQGIALLGGLEVTVLLAIGLFAYLWRRGYRLAALAAFGLPLGTAVELAYKHTVFQPGPPASLSHPDGPSISTVLEGSTGTGWSFPSGHMTRSVVIYGLLAFVIQRLSGRTWLRRAALPLAVLVVLLEAVDRLYLEVHWESDVIGGVLLGATFLAASITWLEWSEARSSAE